jgi:hypothetical protein
MANQVEIKITADPKNAEQGFKKTQSAFGKMAAGIKKHRKAIGVGLTAIGAGITALGVSAVKSAQDEAIGIAQLNVALQNIGTSYDAQAAAIERVIAAQQNKTNFGDEAQREALIDLISVSGDYESAMAALPAVLDLAAGKGMDLSAASTLVARAISGEESALKRYGIAVEEGATATEVISAIMGKFGGQAEAAADPMVQLKNRVGDLQQEFGKALLPMLAQLATLLEGVTRRLIEWTTAHPTLTKVLTVVAAALGALVLVVGPLLLLLPTMAASIGILSGAFAALSISMGPITLIVLGLTAAIAAAILVWQNWDAIIAKVGQIFEWLTGIYKSKLGWLLPAGPLVKGILYLKDTWKEVWDGIKATFAKIGEVILGLYKSKLGWLLPAGPLIKALLFLKDNWAAVWNGITSAFSTVADALVGTFERVKNTILGTWDGMVSGIKSAVNSVVGIINGFIRRINAIEIRVPGVDIPLVGRVGGFSVGMPRIPEIPTLAKGGIVNRPTLAMLGERGPEAVVPLGRSGAGMTINLVINGDIQGMDDFEAKVTSVIRNAVLGGGFQGVLARA